MVVSFIFVVGLWFLLYVWCKLQCFVVTDFILYISMSWCVMQLRKTTLQHVCVFDSVTVLFIPLWKLSITHRFDIRLVSYANAYFICILTTAVLNGRQLPTVLRRI